MILQGKICKWFIYMYLPVSACIRMRNFLDTFWSQYFFIANRSVGIGREAEKTAEAIEVEPRRLIAIRFLHTIVKIDQFFELPADRFRFSRPDRRKPAQRWDLLIGLFLPLPQGQGSFRPGFRVISEGAAARESGPSGILHRAVPRRRGAIFFPVPDKAEGRGPPDNRTWNARNPRRSASWIFEPFLTSIAQRPSSP